MKEGIRQFRIVNIPKDGNCLFHAISFLTNPKTYRTGKSEKEYRSMITKYIQKNDHFDSFIPEKKKYIKRMKKNSVWGGGPEIKAFSMFYRYAISVIDSKKKKIYTFDDSDTYYPYRIFLAYNGSHYEPIVEIKGNKYVSIFNNSTKILKSIKAFYKL